MFFYLCFVSSTFTQLCFFLSLPFTGNLGGKWVNVGDTNNDIRSMYGIFPQKIETFDTIDDIITWLKTP